MLDISSVFSSPDASCRLRFLGEFSCDEFLILVNSQKSTEIHLLNVNGNSSVAFSVKSFMDIISASLSSQRNFIHITERLPSNNGFEFKSHVMKIDEMVKTTDFFSANPVSASFLNQKKSNCVDILHFNGLKLIHLRLTTKGTSLHSEKVLRGANFSSVLCWKFNVNTETLVILQENNQLTVGKFDKRNFIQVVLNAIYKPMTNSDVPDELLLSPHCLSHYPYFRTTATRVEFFSYKNKMCVIEQIFNDSIQNLTFCVSIISKNFKEDVQVLNTPPGFPISTFQDNSLIFVFAQDHFICIIDISKSPPFIFVNCGNLVEVMNLDEQIISLPVSDANYAVSFQHFNIYQISFDYPRAILLLEHNFEPLLASILVQNSPNIQTIISFLVVLQNIGYSVQAAKSMHHLLLNSSPKIQDLAKATKSIEKDLKSCSSNQQILQKVAEFERDNKSAGKLSRTQIFYLGLYFKYKSAKSKRGNESIEISANKIINIMSFQNLIANTINEALPQWIKEYNPSKDWQNIIKYILVKETVDLNFPKIQFLLSFTPTCNDSDLNHYYFPPLDEQNQGGFNISFRKNRSNIANFETIVA